MAGRFAECIAEKNCTLIRYDILQSLRNVFNVTRAERILPETDNPGGYEWLTGQVGMPSVLPDVWRKLPT